MQRLLRNSLVSGALLAACTAIATPAFAAVTVSGDAFYVNSFSGMDCPVQTGPGGGFSNCWATTNGVVAAQPTDPNASLVVAKFENGGEFEKNAFWTSFTSDDVTISDDGNLLYFTYNMDPGDPLLRYITIKQAQDDYALFFNAAGFTSGTTYTFELDRFSPSGWSHLTVFDSTGAVPEPGTWAMMLLGFGGMGMALRRRGRRAGALMQVA